MSERLLCKLVPKTSDYTGGFGGKPEITPLDVAAGLAYLHLGEFETLYIRASLLQSEPYGAKSSLGYASWDWGIKQAEANGWAVPRGKEFMRKMALLAVMRRVDRDQFICTNCGGVGTVLNKRENKLSRCSKCSGTRTDAITGMAIGDGRKKVSNRLYGRFLGINHETYSQTWEPRLNHLIAELEIIENYVVSEISRKVYENCI